MFFFQIRATQFKKKNILISTWSCKRKLQFSFITSLWNQNVLFLRIDRLLIKIHFFFDVEIMLKIQKICFCSINTGYIEKKKTLIKSYYFLILQLYLKICSKSAHWLRRYKFVWKISSILHISIKMFSKNNGKYLKNFFSKIVLFFDFLSGY